MNNLNYWVSRIYPSSGMFDVILFRPELNTNISVIRSSRKLSKQFRPSLSESGFIIQEERVPNTTFVNTVY
jgi:hypothetical protein